PVRRAHAHLAADDVLQTLPFLGRCPHRERREDPVAVAWGGGAAGVGDGGESRGHVREGEGQPDGVPGDGRQAADAEHARVRRRKRSRGEERYCGLDGIGRKRAQIVSEERELVETTRGYTQALAELHESTEVDSRRHARSFYNPPRRGQR